MGALVLTPDGTQGAILSSSGVSVWDLTSVRVLAELSENMGSFDWWERPPLAITKDGHAVYFGYQLRCWKLPDGPVDTLLRQSESLMENDAVRAVLVVDPDAGRVLVSPLEDAVRDRYLPQGTYDTLAVWDLASLEPLATLHPQGSDAVAFALGADGNRVIVAHRDHSVRVWDMNQAESSVIRDHDNPVSYARVLKGTRAITRDQGNQHRFWNLSTGQEIASEDGDCSELAREAQNWLDSREPDTKEQTPGGPVLPESISRREWACAADSSIGVQFDRPTGKYGEVADPPDEAGGEIRIPMEVWELDEEGKPARLRYPAATSASPLNEVRVSSNGKLAVSAAWGSLRVWDLDTGRQRHRLQGHAAPAWGVVLADHDRKAVSISEDATLRVWDLKKGTLLATFTSESPLRAVDAVAIREGDRNVLTVIAGEDSGRVHILRLEAEQEVGASR